ncbi:MAG: BlaI/MecI/CopY family transcriptional regulator [Thermoguttaceae bacterium]
MSEQNNTEKISDAEWKLMHVLWNSGRLSSNDVIAAIVPETGWSPNTVRTLLSRLTEKGILQVEKEKGKEKEYTTCYYTARYSREECEAVHSRTFLERVFAGNTSRLLAHFVKEAGLTPEQIAELRKQLKQ